MNQELNQEMKQELNQEMKQELNQEMKQELNQEIHQPRNDVEEKSTLKLPMKGENNGNTSYQDVGEIRWNSEKSKNKTAHPIDKIDILFACITLLLGYSFVKLVISSSGIGAGFTIFTILFTLVSLGYVYGKKKKVPYKAIPFYIVTILLSLPLALYEFNMFFLLNILFAGISGIYALSVATGVRIEDRIGDYLIEDIFQGFFYRTFHNFGVQPRVFMNIPKKKTSPQKVLIVFISILITIITMVVAINILSNVDNNFAVLIENILDFDSGIEFSFSTLLFTIPISMYLFAGFYSAVNQRNAQEFNLGELLYLQQKRKGIPEIMFMLPMVALTVIYIMFFVSHAMTLNTVLNEKGIVYSEYAKQGFFELCQIAALNIAICLGSTKFCKKKEDGSSAIVLLNTVIGFSTLLIMSTAIIKLGLYVNFYGLTTKRVHGVWALFIILIVFTLLIIQQFKKVNFMKYVSLTIVISYLILSLIGVNQIVVKYNYTNYKNGNLDSFSHYTSNMYFASEVFTPYLIEQWKEESDENVRMEIEDLLLLDIKIEEKYGCESKFDLASFNLEEYRSKKMKESFLSGYLENEF